MREARLILDDGSQFIGRSFGYDANTVGEVVFNTAMTGYPESLTDPTPFVYGERANLSQGIGRCRLQQSIFTLECCRESRIVVETREDTCHNGH